MAVQTALCHVEQSGKYRQASEWDLRDGEDWVNARVLSQVHPVIGFADKDILLKLKPGVRGFSVHRVSDNKIKRVCVKVLPQVKAGVLTVLVLAGLGGIDEGLPEL